jgi:2-iminobutanoate/2-iminopropanoate deaminase
VRTRIQTANAPTSTSPLSQAIRWGDVVYVSGQVGRDPMTGTIPGRTVREQTRQVLANVSAILEAGGASMDSCLKLTCYLLDIDEFAAFNEVYREFFGEEPPARTAVAVAGLANGVLVEVDAIAGSLKTPSGSASAEEATRRVEKAPGPLTERTRKRR